MGAEIGIATGKMHARGLLGPRSLPRLNIWSKETELPAPKVRVVSVSRWLIHREPVGTCNIGYR